MKLWRQIATGLTLLTWLTAGAMAATYYVGPSATGAEDGSSESDLMSWSVWSGSDRSSDTCYFGADMDSSISEYFYWPACQGYFAKYVQVYSTYAVGFRFSDYVRIFQWANGDIGVVDPGSGVSITALTPSPTQINISGTLYDCHGAMVDPVVTWDQGFHGRANNYSSTGNVGPGIAAGTPYTLTAGHTLVHTHGKTVADSEISWVYEAAALHCVSEVPSVLSFRPTYAGGTAAKTIHAASNVNLDLLGDIAIVGTGAPTKAGVEAAARTLWLEKIPSYPNRYIHPHGSRPAYGSYLSDAFARYSLWTNTNQTDDDKVMAVRMLVQAGIDIWGMIHSSAAGIQQLTPDNGGHGLSKMVWAYAGWLLGDATMLADLAHTGDYILTTAGDYHYWPADFITSSEAQSYIVDADAILTPPWPVREGSWGSDVGTISVTNGSTTVTGSGTSWLSVSNHGMIAVLGASGYTVGDDGADDPEAHAYYVSAVVSNTELTLASPYTGPTADDKRYLMGNFLVYGHGNVNAITDYGISEDAIEFTAEDFGLPTWGIGWGYGGYYSPNAATAGKGWYTGARNKFDHKYQPTFLQAVSGNLLVMLVMGMQGVWNHDASIRYADRAATVADRDSDWWSPWLRQMWDEYRPDYLPTPWTPKCHTPVPAHSAVAVGTSQVLSWYDGNGRAAGTSCNVYFGTSPASLTQVETQSTDYEYTPTLEAGTTYYWRVDEVCPGGTYTGDVWSFTTEGAPAAKAYLLIRR